MDIIGNAFECFDKIYSYYEPVDNSFKDNIYISNSLLPQSHFENDFDDIIDEFQKITETKLQFDTVQNDTEQYNHNYNLK